METRMVIVDQQIVDDDLHHHIYVVDPDKMTELEVKRAICLDVCKPDDENPIDFLTSLNLYPKITAAYKALAEHRRKE